MRLIILALLASVATTGRPLYLRRNVLVLTTPFILPTQHAAAASPFDNLVGRLEASIVKEPDVTPNADAPSLPPWIIGRWQCTQTLQKFTTPQGVEFTAAPGQPVREAEKSAMETRAQIGRPVELELRYQADRRGGATEDRAFNARSRFDAFAGRPVVRTSEACESENSRIREGRSAADVRAGRLVACTIIDFKGGGATQKVLVNSLRVAVSPSGQRCVSSEFSRATLARILAPGDTRNFPPITIDSETMVDLESAGGEERLMSVQGRLRLVDYLNPNDALYFAAGKRAVAISDYSLSLSRLPD